MVLTSRLLYVLIKISMVCNIQKTRPCGKGCRSLSKPCKIDGTPGVPRESILGRVTTAMTVKPVTGKRKCRVGKTRPCGKTCRSIYKPCKIDGTPGVSNPDRFQIDKSFEPDKQKMKLAVDARQRAVREKDPKKRRVLEDKARIAFANAYVDDSWFRDRRVGRPDLKFLTVPFTGSGDIWDQRGVI